MPNFPITQEMINHARELGACSEALDWLEAQPRKWTELVAHNSE